MTTIGVERTILLLGADGQLGWELRRTLQPLGRIVATTRAEIDASDATSVRTGIARLRPELVVNATAYTAVDRAEADVEACERVNAVAPGEIGRAAADSGAAVVHYSTDYVFDGTLDRPYREDDATHPLGVYGRTKLAGERALADSGAPYFVFRTSWVYGRRGKNFMRTMLRLARERPELRIVADQIGAPTWSRGLAEATAAALAHVAGEAGGSVTSGVAGASGVYHLTSAGSTSWHGFAERILALDPARDEQVVERLVAIRTSEYPTPATRPLNSRLDCSRAAERFGIRLPDWKEQLALAMAPE